MAAVLLSLNRAGPAEPGLIYQLPSTNSEENVWLCPNKTMSAFSCRARLATSWKKIPSVKSALLRSHKSWLLKGFGWSSRREFYKDCQLVQLESPNSV